MKPSETYLEFIHDVLITVHSGIHELQGRLAFCDPAERDYIEGRIFSYTEFLQTLQTSAREFGLSDEIGL
ncbi:hypothetical protein [Siphonobacter curvatus]|uniref:Uncharacterized protein n=1 Tax=Siphonobacter curvatus TaxID=2094562 RepID=A0A2S7IMB7_9BACT|nr:hypothetical protein [Siphonobacter curvatus]PQA58867.1 hypothetical protein C5O19_04190 [Siphonobacter curvatus]